MLGDCEPGCGVTLPRNDAALAVSFNLNLAQTCDHGQNLAHPRPAWSSLATKAPGNTKEFIGQFLFKEFSGWWTKKNPLVTPSRASARVQPAVTYSQYDTVVCWRRGGSRGRTWCGGQPTPDSARATEFRELSPPPYTTDGGILMFFCLSCVTIDRAPSRGQSIVPTDPEGEYLRKK